MVGDTLDDRWREGCTGQGKGGEEIVGERYGD